MHCIVGAPWRKVVKSRTPYDETLHRKCRNIAIHRDLAGLAAFHRHGTSCYISHYSCVARRNHFIVDRVTSQVDECCALSRRNYSKYREGLRSPLARIYCSPAHHALRQIRAQYVCDRSTWGYNLPKFSRLSMVSVLLSSTLGYSNNPMNEWKPNRVCCIS